MVKVSALAVVAGMLVAVVGGYWLYHGAVNQVDAVLARPLWKEPGQISGTLSVMPGLQVGAADVAGALAKAGYSRVSVVAEDGDFSVQGPLILVRDHGADVLITFNKAAIASVSPNPTHHFRATELAGVGGDGHRRRPISRGEMAEHLVLAVLAMEDSRFFEHGGVDGWGIVRALVVNVLGDGHKQGGSTLTQQLAKNLFLSPERTIKRKIRELALAVALEDRLTKEEILELYLNQVYLGSVGGAGVSGVAKAASTYFGTSASRLSLGQAATLAGIISAPNRYSPARHPERAAKRRDLVLGRMVDLGWLAEDERLKAASKDMRVEVQRNRRLAPWALDEVVDRVEASLGEGTMSEGAVSVQTTIDALLQRVAERAVADGLKELEAKYPRSKNAEVAVVALDPSNGDVLAMVGGRSYGKSSYNRVTKALRQAGSTVKGLSWLALVEADHTISSFTVLADEPIEREVNGKTWAPNNYDGEFLGEVSLEEALATSRNIPAIHVAESVGMDALVEHFGRLGMSGLKPYPSMALGAFEVTPLALASAYTVFPGHGRVVSPRLIRSVRRPDGTEGWKDGVSKQRVVSDRAAFLVGDMLAVTVSEGTGRRVKQYGVAGEVGGKTGTTDGGRDAWFVGYTPELVVAVWVGFDRAKDLGLTGAQAALPIWARLVAGSGRMVSAEPVPPESVEAVSLCGETGALATASCPGLKEVWVSARADKPEACVLHDEGVFAGTRSIIERLRLKLFRKRADSSSGAIGAD